MVKIPQFVIYYYISRALCYGRIVCFFNFIHGCVSYQKYFFFRYVQLPFILFHLYFYKLASKWLASKQFRIDFFAIVVQEQSINKYDISFRCLIKYKVIWRRCLYLCRMFRNLKYHCCEISQNRKFMTQKMHKYVIVSIYCPLIFFLSILSMQHGFTSDGRALARHSNTETNTVDNEMMLI